MEMTFICIIVGLIGLVALDALAGLPNNEVIR
jgi:hypothetical protein